jgi:hypothetical protein
MSDADIHLSRVLMKSWSDDASHNASSTLVGGMLVLYDCRMCAGQWSHVVACVSPGL